MCFDTVSLKWKLFGNLNQLFSKHRNEILFSLPPFSKMQCLSRFLSLHCLNISFTLYTPNHHFIRMLKTRFTPDTRKQSLNKSVLHRSVPPLKSLDLLDWGIELGTELTSSGIFWQQENMPHVKRREISFLNKRDHQHYPWTHRFNSEDDTFSNNLQRSAGFFVPVWKTGIS